jgi:hypothetical protein
MFKQCRNKKCSQYKVCFYNDASAEYLIKEDIKKGFMEGIVVKMPIIHPYHPALMSNMNGESYLLCNHLSVLDNEKESI